MHDDSPWKPPTDDGEPTAPEPTVPEADQPADTAESAPVLPNTPVSPETPAVPTLPPSLPTSPAPESAAPSLPPSMPAAPVAPPPPAPTDAAASPWAPGGAGGAVPPRPVPPPGPTSSVPPAPPAGWTSSTPPEPGGVPMPTGHLVDPMSEPERPRRSRWIVGSAVAAVLAVGGAGVFAVANLTGSTAGGASAPEELGIELLTAIENEDVLGMIDVLLPGEREALGDPFVDMVSELQRLEVLAETDLSQIAGLDVELSNEGVQVRTTNVDDIVNIDLRADVAVSVDGAELPIGALITDNLDDDDLTEMRGTKLTQTDSFDIWLTAVQHDDRWYFSLLHSVAELGRSEAAPGTAIPAEGVGADGADSPEAAFDQMLDRIEALDLTGIIRSLNPGEAAALQRYAPLFLEEADAALAEVPLRWEITERAVRVEGDGDTRTAFIDAIAIEGDVDGSPFSFDYRDGCVTASLERDTFEACGNSFGIDGDGIDEWFGDEPEVMHAFEVIESAFADIEPAGIELRQHDGEWFVSPMGTMTEALLKVLRALDRDEIDEIIEAFEAAFGGLEDAIFESMDEIASGGGLLADESFTADEMTELDVLFDELEPLDEGTFGDGGSFDEGSDWFECYEALDAAEATTCFESYVETGEIDRSAMPVVLRHPECGYAELSWSNEVYSLPDAEFIAAAEGARDCFLALVDAGEVSEFELPSEITHLECFEGRNWYQVFDDPAYDERYYECIGTVGSND